MAEAFEEYCKNYYLLKTTNETNEVECDCGVCKALCDIPEVELELGASMTAHFDFFLATDRNLKKKCKNQSLFVILVKNKMRYFTKKD